MLHRAAATTAAILAPFGIAVAVPVLTSAGGVPAAMAGADNASPGDNLTDENPPPDTQPTPTPTPTPTPPVTPPAPVPVLPPLPPKPQDTLSSDSTPTTPSDSNSSSGNSSSGTGSSSPSGPVEHSVESQRLSVAQSTPSTVSDTGAIPEGGVQAGGGGTAPNLRDAGSSEGALGAAAGLVILVTGTGLVLRRRHGATAR